MSEKQKSPSMADLLAQLATMQAQLAAAEQAAEQARQEAAAAKASASKKGRAPKTHEALMSSNAWYRMGWAIKAIDPTITNASDACGRAAGRALAVMFADDPGNLAGGNIRQYAARSANVIAGYLAAESQTASPDTIRRYKALYEEFCKYASDGSLTADQIDYARRMPAIADTQAAYNAAAAATQAAAADAPAEDAE